MIMSTVMEKYGFITCPNYRTHMNNQYATRTEP